MDEIKIKKKKMVHFAKEVLEDISSPSSSQSSPYQRNNKRKIPV